MFIVYILLATSSAGWFYWERINMDYHDVDHDLDICLSAIVGLFFPIVAPPALLFCYLRKLKEKRDNE